jgi:GT2 family glycosyltransferase
MMPSLTDTPSVKLSVVVISKNQGWNLNRLVTSIFREAGGDGRLQVLIVDSASSDDTLDRAKRWPVQVITLDGEQQLCPSTGRYVGGLFVEGQYVLFLDGDLELWPGWLAQSLRTLERNPRLAGVTGDRVFVSEGAASPFDSRPRQTQDSQEITAVAFLGSVGLYRREILDRVGGFRAHLLSDEEPDLGLRIRVVGYELGHTNSPVAVHYGEQPDDIMTLFRRRRRRLYLGYGQNFRSYLGTSLFWKYLSERGFALLPAAVLLAGALAALPALLSDDRLWLGAWVGVIALGLAFDAVRKHSVRRVLFSVIHRLIILDGTVRGFLMKPMDEHSQPVIYRVVR